MELFLPGLIILIVSAIFAFFIIPRTGVMILATVCLFALIAAGIHHYTTFYSEYTLSTWQNGLKENAIFIILGLALLFIVGAIMFMFQGPAQAAEETPMETLQNAVANAAVNMPSANTATNPFTSAINTGMNAFSGVTEGITGAVNQAKNFATGAVNQVTGAVTGAVNQAKTLIPGTPNNQKKGPSPLIPGLNFRASEL